MHKPSLARHRSVRVLLLHTPLRSADHAQELITQIKNEGLLWRAQHADAAIALMQDPATVEQAQNLEISGAG